MSKTVIAILLLVAPAFAVTDQKPEYSKQAIKSFQDKVKAQTAKKDLWASYEALMKELSSEKIVVNNQNQLVYMNSLMLALNEITEKDFNAGKCSDMSNRMDDKFLTKGVEFKHAPQHYQDAKNILNSICK